MVTWAATEAMTNLGEILDRAETLGPQVIERHNRRFVLVAEEEFHRSRATAEPQPHQPQPAEPQPAELQPAAAKPFVSAWELLRPPEEDLFDFELERPEWKSREIEL